MSRIIKTTNLERENLEAHVDLCAERYSYLESRLNAIEDKMDDISHDIQSKVNSIHNDIQDSKYFVGKILIGSTVSIVLAILTLVFKH